MTELLSLRLRSDKEVLCMKLTNRDLCGSFMNRHVSRSIENNIEQDLALQDKQTLGINRFCYLAPFVFTHCSDLVWFHRFEPRCICMKPNMSLLCLYNDINVFDHIRVGFHNNGKHLHTANS